MTAAGRTLVAELPAFEVAAEPDEVARWCALFAAPEVAPGGELPCTYPIAWLSAAPVRAALARLGGDAVLVHEAQRIAHLRRPRLGERYRVAIRIERESDPSRLRLLATISDPDGAARTRCEAELRLLARPDPSP